MLIKPWLPLSNYDWEIIKNFFINFMIIYFKADLCLLNYFLI